MKLYEERLFYAFVMTQAVENQVHDLVLYYVDNGRLNLDENQCAKLRELTLGRLIERVKPCLDNDLYNKLRDLKDKRNEVVHRSNYVQNIFCPEESEEDLHDEIIRLHTIAIDATKIWYELLSLFQPQDLTDQS